MVHHGPARRRPRSTGHRRPKRGCLATIAIGVLGALLAGAVSRFATGDAIDTFDDLDLGSIFVAFVGAAALLLVLEAASGRRR